MTNMSEKKLWLLEEVKNFYNQNSRFPTTREIHTLFGVPRRSLRRYFGSLSELMQLVLDDIDEPLFTEDRANKIKDLVSTAKKYVITTAVVGAPVCESSFKSIKQYCKLNNAELLILVSADPAANVSDGLDESLKGENIVFQDTFLNDNLKISSIKMSAKQIQPHTGLGRFGQRNTSMIFGSPKQNLDYVSVANNKLPHALMTTGAITLPAYHTTRYMSRRTAYIAEHDHVMGALIVEIENEKNFHFRQIQFNDSGCFYDLGMKYNGINKPTQTQLLAVVLGDWHTTHTDITIRQATFDFLSVYKPKHLLIHDCFNGDSINHHVIGKNITRAKLTDITLKQELDINKTELGILKSYTDKLVIVKSNHDYWIDRYLDECRFVYDPLNFRLSLDLAAAKYDGFDPFEHYINDPDIKFLKRDEDFIIKGIQLGAHGDIEGSMTRAETTFGNAVIAHSHSAAILRGIYRVGTSTPLKEDYVTGSTAWTNTHCIINEDGSRQLINFINGKYKP